MLLVVTTRGSAGSPTVSIPAHSPRKMKKFVRQTPTRKQFIAGNTNRAGGVLHYVWRDKQSQITMSHQQQKKGERDNAFLHWECSNKWFPGSYSACFPIHISWQLPVKLAMGERRKTKGYLQAQNQHPGHRALFTQGPLGVQWSLESKAKKQTRKPVSQSL